MRAIAALATVAIAGLAATTVATGAAAAPIRAEVEREAGGRCTATSDWDLNLEKESGRIEVDIDIDSQRSGQRWKVTATHNDRTFYNRTRTTDNDGEIDVDRTVPDRKGRDRISFRAVSSTGEVCRGSLRI